MAVRNVRGIGTSGRASCLATIQRQRPGGSINTLNATSVPERFPIASSRDRWLEFLELEHDTLARVRDFARDGDELVVWRETSAGRVIADGRVPRSLATHLFLQAASAAAFFAARGFTLGPRDFDDSRWELSSGTARLWLTRTPGAVGSATPGSPAGALVVFLQRLFERGGRITSPAVRWRDRNPGNGKPDSGSL